MAGGTLTLIGTTTNILAADIFHRLGFEPIGIFEFTKLGVIVLITAMLYFLIIGRFLLPKRETPRNFLDPFEKFEYQTEIVVLPKSPLIFQRVRNNDLKVKFKIDILQINRKK